jgi:hypothetical protein
VSKLSYKIKRFGIYLTLISYLIIVTLNAFHHHNIDLGKADSISNAIDLANLSHSYNSNAEAFCPIQTAYNSLQNTIISNENSYQNYKLNTDIIHFQKVFVKPLKSNIHHYSLRAPPTLFFS